VKLDESARNQLIQMLRVDDIQFTQSVDSITVHVMLSGMHAFDKIEMRDLFDTKSAPMLIVDRLQMLAEDLRRGLLDLPTMVDRSIRQVASLYGMSATTLNEASALREQPPIKVTSQMFVDGEPEQEPPRRLLNRFEAVAEELKKL
jgi:hypothetical protein